MEIRPEQDGDIGAIRALTEAAFRDAPYSDGTEAAIVDALRVQGGLTLSLVADVGGVVVGHVAFSPVTIDGEFCDWYGLGPVSVLPGRQKQGIGAALIREGLKRLLGDHLAKGCVVLGEPGYYGRFGFVSDPGLRYQGAPAEYFQRLVFVGKEPKGVVKYHEGFGEG